MAGKVKSLETFVRESAIKKEVAKWSFEDCVGYVHKHAKDRIKSPLLKKKLGIVDKEITKCIETCTKSKDIEKLSKYYNIPDLLSGTKSIIRQHIEKCIEDTDSIDRLLEYYGVSGLHRDFKKNIEDTITKKFIPKMEIDELFDHYRKTSGKIKSIFLKGIEDRINGIGSVDELIQLCDCIADLSNIQKIVQEHIEKKGATLIPDENTYICEDYSANPNSRSDYRSTCHSCEYRVSSKEISACKKGKKPEKASVRTISKPDDTFCYSRFYPSIQALRKVGGGSLEQAMKRRNINPSCSICRYYINNKGCPFKTPTVNNTEYDISEIRCIKDW